MTDSFDLPGTIEISELIEFLHQQLHDLPDTRKPGNNTKYQVEDAVPAFLTNSRIAKGKSLTAQGF